MRGDRRDLWPERFCYTHPPGSPSALCLSRPTAPTRAPTPTVILPARQPASLLPCRRMRAGLRPSGSRCRDACCLLSWRLGRRPRYEVAGVPGRVRSLGAHLFSCRAKRGVREIRSGCAAQRVGGAERPGPAREHVRRDRISRSLRGQPNRGAACVALRNPSSGDICRPPRPGERPQANFFSRPGASSHPNHARRSDPFRKFRNWCLNQLEWLAF